MKKITYLVAPLMVLPLLVGCGGGGDTPVPPEDITYKVSVSDKSDKHLKFLSEDGQDLNQVKAKNGESFKFKIEAEKVDDTQYTVVKDYVFVAVGSDVLTDGVEIYWDGENEADHSKATVTIDAAKVTGDIVVGAKAGIKDHYLFTYPFLSGLEKPKITPEDAEDKNHPGYIWSTKKATIEFPLKSGAKKTSLGALIDIDGLGYDAPEEYWEYTGIDFDYENYKLTIDPGTADEPNVVPQDSFSIIARSTGDGEWLDTFEWSDIKYISENGLAEKIFTEGDEKTIQTKDDLNYQVRIIGFNHDTLASDKSKKAGITFQFKNLISSDSDSDNKPIKQAWGTSGTCHQDFIHSDYNKYLDSVYTDLLPEDLKAAIVPVVKKVGVYSESTTPKWKPTDYEPYLFPLAYEEIKEKGSSKLNVDGEGTVYSYFINATSDKYKLAALDGSNAAYWLRSPSTQKHTIGGNTYNRAFEVTASGTIYADDGAEAYNSKGVAPCFCI